MTAVLPDLHQALVEAHERLEERPSQRHGREPSGPPRRRGSWGRRLVPLLAPVAALLVGLVVLFGVGGHEEQRSSGTSTVPSVMRTPLSEQRRQLARLATASKRFRASQARPLGTTRARQLWLAPSRTGADLCLIRTGGPVQVPAIFGCKRAADARKGGIFLGVPGNWAGWMPAGVRSVVGELGPLQARIPVVDEGVEVPPLVRRVVVTVGQRERVDYLAPVAGFPARQYYGVLRRPAEPVDADTQRALAAVVPDTARVRRADARVLRVDPRVGLVAVSPQGLVRNQPMALCLAARTFATCARAADSQSSATLAGFATYTRGTAQGGSLVGIVPDGVRAVTVRYAERFPVQRLAVRDNGYASLVGQQPTEVDWTDAKGVSWTYRLSRG